MYPFAQAMMIGAEGVKFVGTTFLVSPGALTFPAGARVNDLALVIASGVSVAITGWSSASDGQCWMLWRRLTSSDLSSPPSITGNSSTLILVYRGVKQAAKRSGVTSAAPGSVTVNGFVKAGAKAVVTAARNESASALTPPTGFASRAFLSGGGFAIGAADTLSPSTYVDGANMVWTANGNLNQDGLGIELT